MDVLIVGGGNMGKTFAQSFLNAKVLRKENIHILDIRIKDVHGNQSKTSLKVKFNPNELEDIESNFIPLGGQPDPKKKGWKRGAWIK